MLPELSDIVDEGFVHSPRRNPYYMGLYPCYQLVGDADANQVTDISGQAAHATLGALSTAEAWANTGYVSSVATTDKCARIPLAKWPFRFTYGNLICFAYQQLVYDGVNGLRIFGNGSNSVNNGFNILCNSLGGLQINITNPGGVSFFSTSTSATPYTTNSLHSWMLAYRKKNASFSVWVDGVRYITQDSAISRANVEAADTLVTNGPAIGGRPIIATNLVAVRTKYVHTLNIDRADLPINLDIIAKRLHSAPHLELPESALVF